MRLSLAGLTLRGFKTIRELKDFQLDHLNLLIGPNGAGKSNLLSFFRMLSWAWAPPGCLQTYVAEQGGASSLLCDRPQGTHATGAVLTFETELGPTDYGFELHFAHEDTFVFFNEWYQVKELGVKRPVVTIAVGHREPKLAERAETGDRSAAAILKAIRRMIVYHFQNTAATSRFRNKWNMDDGQWLREDGGNLAPFLYRLQQSAPKYYRRIVETLRLILPFFADFELAPEQESLLLRWRESGTDRVFSASQAADGMLRAMALVALLQQPEDDLPELLILDEPELGLHPFAIQVVADLLQSAAHHTRVIVATQSVSLIDRFEPHDIVVVERPGRESTFRRLDDSELAEWREQYTLSELWEKNVLGGRPAR